jgi:hypothetical protein
MRLKSLVVATTVLAILIFVPNALAGDVTRLSVDLTGVTLTCSTEPVVLRGTASVVASDEFTPSGVHTGHLLLRMTGLTAVGQSSQTAYRVVGVSSSGFSFRIGGERSDVSTFTQTWLLQSTSGGPPLSFKQVLTVVHDADGRLVSLVSQGPSDCD